MASYVWVDPPSGWRYGFPKIWNTQGDMQEWLIDNKYPENEIKRMGNLFYVRCWEATEEEIVKFGNM